MKKKSLPARVYRFAGNLVEPLLPRSLVTPSHWLSRRLTGRLEAEYDMIMSLVKPGRTVVDAGANIGIYTYGFLSRGADVVAFEPLPACASLIRSFYDGGFPRATARGGLTVYQEALGDSESRAVLHVPLRNGKPDDESASLEKSVSQSEFDIEVVVRPLDAHELNDVQIIKMDVEGHEVAALAGAARTIARSRPAILVEIEQRHHEEPLTDVFASIHQIVGPGYRTFFLGSGGNLRPLSEFDVVRQQLSLADNPLHHDYVRNFFILHDHD